MVTNENENFAMSERERLPIIFNEVKRQAEVYGDAQMHQADHAINMAMNRFGISGYKERELTRQKLKKMIDGYQDTDSNERLERTDGRHSDNLFVNKDRELRIAMARERLKEYPDLQEYRREWV